MTHMPKFNRRSFVVGSSAAGAGLALGFNLPLGANNVVRAADGSPEVDAWVVIKPDDTVVIRIARSEMGQGTLTGLAQLVAEELDCDWSKVTTEFPTPGQNVARKRVWGDFSTGGSRGIRESNEYVRKGGATARMMLIQAAANAWNVPVAECSAANSVITHKASGRTVTYGKVAEAAAKLDPPKDVPLKDPKDWTIAGKPLKRLDTPDKIIGKTVFGIDIRQPEHALRRDQRLSGVRRQAAKLSTTAKVTDMPGVKKVVQVGDNAVAVVADYWWRAKKALDALADRLGRTATTPRSPAPRSRNSSRKASTPTRLSSATSQATSKAALAGAAKVVEAIYSYPYQNHAPMEPMNATALYTADRCEVWCSTQNGEAALAATAEASGLPVAQCDVHKTFLGGGFGRRGQTDYVRQAVADRQGDARHAGEAVVVARRGHDPLLLSPDHAVQDDGGLRRQQEPDRAAYAHFGPVDPGHGVPGAAWQNGMDPVVFQGLNPGGPEGAFGYNIPNLLIDHAMRNPSVPAGLLARRQHQPQRDLRRDLHGPAGQ